MLRGSIYYAGLNGGGWWLNSMTVIKTNSLAGSLFIHHVHEERDLWRSQECRLLFGNALEFFDLSLWLIEMDHHHHPVYYSSYAYALPGPLDKCTASGEEAAPMNRSSPINSTVEDLLLLDWQWIIKLEHRREGKSPSINRTWMMTDYFRGFTSIGTIPSPSTTTTIGNKQQPSQESTCNGGNRNPSIAWLSRNYNSVNALSWPNRISTKRGEQDRVIRWSPILDHLVSVCLFYVMASSNRFVSPSVCYDEAV